MSKNLVKPSNLGCMFGVMQQDREHEQPRVIQQADYVNLAVTNNTYNVGTEVYIIYIYIYMY